MLIFHPDNFFRVFSAIYAAALSCNSLPIIISDKKVTVLESSERNCEPISHSVETLKKTKKDENCLWTKEELDVFRDGYFNLKRRAVHLLILLSDSKTRNSELRKKCKNKDIIIANQEHLLSAQKKEIMKLTATIKELQKDLGYSEKKLQQLLIIEAQFKDQNAFLKTELEEERNEIEKLQLACRDLNRSLSSMQRKTELDLVEQRNILIAQYKHTQEKVEEEKEKLQKELEQEKQEHHSTKIALDQLRRHFAHKQANKTDKFIDVTETENLE